MRHFAVAGDRQPRAHRAHPDAHATHAARPPRQDLRHALGQRFQEPGVRLPRRQADSMGQPHHQQGARDPAALVLGDDLRLRALRLVRGLRRARQHLLHLQPEDPRRQRARVSRAARPLRLPVVLPVPRRQPDPHQLGRYDLRPVGHRDRAAVRAVHRPHRRRHVAVAGARPAHLRVRRLRRLRQAVGHPRLPVQADLPGPRERHQRRHVLPVRVRVRDGLGRRDVPHVRHPRRPGAGHVLARQHHLRHHVRGLLQVRPPAARRLRRLQLQRVGLHEERACRHPGRARQPRVLPRRDGERHGRGHRLVGLLPAHLELGAPAPRPPGPPHHNLSHYTQRPGPRGRT
ncbi:uncharacterized protein LOC133530637 isoform X1 [Cydia pomonella]|uniref:uncharacterized protein LOC133530637 isoform X1 n=1 Tax=Cydia pomonella TaxID=82600 RepID=UPI002ADD5413|nr:uncharacterized protein LOC133530637 isoform X1 [Cydia pomonella]